MPALAEHPQELTASNATSGTLESIAVFVGPALGGLLLPVTSVSTVFLLNVATFLVSMALVIGVRPSRVAHPSAPAPGTRVPERPGLAVKLSAGFRTVLGDGDLRVVTGQVCAQTFVGGAAKVFLVVLAVDVMRTGASGVGFLDAVVGIGAVGGGLLAIARATRQRLGRDMTLGVLLWSLPLALIVVWPSPGSVVASLLMLGVANPLVDVNLDTIIQRMTPDGFLARVFGALDACYIATGALGSLVMPLLLVWVGLRWSLVLVAAPVALVAALSLRRMARLDARLRAPEALPLLAGIPWFSALHPGVLESLARSLVSVSVAAGQAVVSQGENADRFYVIESGRVEVTQDGRVLRHQGPGDFFGEIGLLHDVPRTATVTATEETVLQALDRGPFLGAVTGQSRSLAERVASTRLAFEG
ncbi:MAG: cyclic nucleotide-binding domain-containing protein [Marmoricola sp.]